MSLHVPVSILDVLGIEMPCPGISGIGNKDGFGAREIYRRYTHIYLETKDLNDLSENLIFSIPYSQETATR
jgi:hypothetical protein